jgi:hypothetical protein
VTEDGSLTRLGAVIRADSIHRLTDAGWVALVDHGVRTVVDLRVAVERLEDQPHPNGVDVVQVPLGGLPGETGRVQVDAAWALGSSPRETVRLAYSVFLEHFRGPLAEAVAAVGRARDGGVLIHCFAGKDRTGLVCALLLRLAGVSPADIAADYSLSASNLRPVIDPWVTDAPDDTERERRRRLGSSPAEAMLDVLDDLERRHGGVRAYLLAGDVTARDLDRARDRLLA